jgi:hypothetical protein
MISSGETLLSASAIKLYGRVIPGLEINITAAGAGLGNNKFLQHQLEATANPKFARIYGYSYEGAYTPLAKPTIFLVHGDGEKAAPKSVAFEVVKEEVESPFIFQLNTPDDKPQQVNLFIDGAGLAPSPTKLDKSGVAAKTWEFASDVRIWEYDRGDFSLRLDIDSGPLERLLINCDESDKMPYFGSSRTRLRGPND